MKTYKVKLTYSVYETIYIEANNPIEASDKAYEYGMNSHLDHDYIDIEVEEEED